MIVYREKRVRIGYPLSSLYKVRSWYLFGFVLIYRRYEQLTARFEHATASEVG